MGFEALVGRPHPLSPVSNLSSSRCDTNTLAPGHYRKNLWLGSILESVGLVASARLIMRSMRTTATRAKFIASLDPCRVPRRVAVDLPLCGVLRVLPGPRESRTPRLISRARGLALLWVRTSSHS